MGTDSSRRPGIFRNPNMDWLFLGGVVPWALGFIFNFFSDPGLVEPPYDALVEQALPVLLWTYLLLGAVLFVVGLKRGNRKMRSFGQGALASYAILAIGGLLLWGACSLGG